MDLNKKSITLEILDTLDTNLPRGKRAVMKAHLQVLVDNVYFGNNTERLMYQEGFQAGFLAAQTFNSEAEGTANTNMIQGWMGVKDEEDT